MEPTGRVPLAWQNLTHNLWRLLVAVSGVTFAVVLMFMERGFQKGLFDNTVALVRNLDADIILVSGARFSITGTSCFSVNQISVAEHCDGVAEVQPLYLEKILSTLRKPNFTSRPIRAIGLDIRSGIFTSDLQQSLNAHRDQLLTPGAALIDETSKRSIYGINASDVSSEERLEVELANQRLRLIGTFRLGTDFANDGTLIMSRENFAEYFRGRGGPGGPLSVVDVGLVKCEPGANHEAVIGRLNAALGSTIEVSTREAFITDEIEVWDKNTPIGKIFLVGTIMGFIVGILICYQVLYTDIADHMSEFATLKAMGYNSGFFIRLVVRESVYLSILGFIPGTIISWGLFQGITWLTGLTMALSLTEIGLTFLLTLVMCILSGLLAVRKLLATDPASLF